MQWQDNIILYNLPMGADKIIIILTKYIGVSKLYIYTLSIVQIWIYGI